MLNDLVFGGLIHKRAVKANRFEIVEFI